MKPVKVFISYSHLDNTVAGEISTIFHAYFGFDTFLAHDDLRISEVFPKEVKKHLAIADYVVPLISPNFLCSAFANQEIGLALSWGKKILPISVDGTTPPGFIKDSQARKCHDLSEGSLIRVVTEIYFLSFQHPKYKEYKEKCVGGLVNAFCQSKHFKITSVTVDVMTEVKKSASFSKEQIELMKKAIKDNFQIYGADLVMPKVRIFMKNCCDVAIDS
jgi:hypothetical protein